ncbi:MAG: DUF1501 domain-containing protein [Planctomycetota bacterium]
MLVFLRGGMDGLSLVAPYGDPDYAAHRPTQAIPAPGSIGGGLNLNGFFALHPAAAALYPFYGQGKLAVVHTVGSPDPTLSHFDAQNRIESAYIGQLPPPGHEATGWMGRHMAALVNNVPLRGVVLENTITLAAAGAPGTLPMPDPAEFSLSGYQSTIGARRSLLRMLYDRTIPALARPAIDTLEAIDYVQGIDFAGYVPQNGAMYPSGSDFAHRLLRAATLIREDVGVEFIEIDSGGWDDHDGLGANVGPFYDRVQDLADSLAAFATDLGTTMNRVTVVVMSEFGRRVTENGSQGVDHGRAGAMLLLGNRVAGGQVVHDWQGLTPADLDDGSLPVRIDYRDVLAEVLAEQMGCTNLGIPFPSFAPTFRNLIQ